MCVSPLVRDIPQIMISSSILKSPMAYGGFRADKQANKQASKQV